MPIDPEIFSTLANALQAALALAAERAVAARAAAAGADQLYESIARATEAARQLRQRGV